MQRTVFAFLFLALAHAVPVSAADDPAAVRARAALAIAFADAGAKPLTYADLHAKAVRDGTPLVVWVGQPARPVAGCLTVRNDRFPGADAVAVVVGVPGNGALRRIDLPGTPTEAAIRSAVRGTDVAARAPELPGGR
ncbi:MAG: hypothetical protein ACRC7O_12350 [Fimbriiglobus sp.]